MKKAEPWKITLVDTGEITQTGGRLKRVSKYLNEETFCFTYGDGVSNINIQDLISHHKESGRKATVTAVQPPEDMEPLNLEMKIKSSFQEKPKGDGGWINGGFLY